MIAVLKNANIFLEDCFKIFQAAVPPVSVVQIGGEKTLRYVEETREQAALQKFARCISGLNASLLLLEAGYVQEVGAIFRMLDEFNEDITFLVLPNVGGEHTKFHDEYLKDFYQEEFDNPENATLSTQSRKTIPRRKIHSYIAQSNLAGMNPHDHMLVMRTISQAYGGYIHAASGHVVELISGPPFQYHLSGMRGTPRQDEFMYNYWDYSYRGCVVAGLMSKAFGMEEIFLKCREFLDKFEEITGDTGR